MLLLLSLQVNNDRNNCLEDVPPMESSGKFKCCVIKLNGSFFFENTKKKFFEKNW